MEKKEKKSVWMLGHEIHLIPCGGQYFVLDVVTPRGVSGPPPHLHEDSDEMFYVLEGALELLCGEDWQRVEAGESFNVPRGEVHTFRNPTEGSVRWLTAWNPPGFQDWFANHGVNAAEPDAAARSVSEDAILAAVGAAASYGMVLAED